MRKLIAFVLVLAVAALAAGAVGVGAETHGTYTVKKVKGPRGKRGPRGHVGPKGDQGPQGIQGPFGPQHVSNVWRSAAPLELPAGQTKQGDSFCPTNWGTISGGFEVVDPTGAGKDVTVLESQALNSLAAWRVTARNAGASPATVSVVALCAPYGYATRIGQAASPVLSP